METNTHEIEVKFPLFFKLLFAEGDPVVYAQLVWDDHEFKLMESDGGYISDLPIKIIYIGNNISNNHRSIDVDWHDARTIEYALIQRLKEVEREVSILRVAFDANSNSESDLSRTLRLQLPVNLQKLTLSELAEQYNPWLSLRDRILSLIDEFHSLYPSEEIK